METKKIVGVKFENKLQPRTFGGREYSYYTDIPLEVGDIVEIPTRYGTGTGEVTKVDIPEKEIESIKEFMKNITAKLNKEEYLNGSKD